MKNDPDLVRETAEWLKQGSRPLPAGVLKGAMSEVSRTRQLSPAHPRWTVRLARAVALAAAAAAVVVAVAFGPLVADRLHGLLSPSASTAVGANPSVGASASVEASPSIAASATPEPSLPPANPLLGSWHTTDSDGSSMLVTVSKTADGTISVLWTDDFASWCQKNWPSAEQQRLDLLRPHAGPHHLPQGAPITTWMAHGVGTLGERISAYPESPLITLQGTWDDVGCGGLWWTGDWSFELSYDQVRHLLFFGDGLTWSRVAAP